jgi:hypothetical protein
VADRQAGEVWQRAGLGAFIGLQKFGMGQCKVGDASFLGTPPPSGLGIPARQQVGLRTSSFMAPGERSWAPH